MQPASSPLSGKFYGKKVSVFRLVNKKGTEALISNYGALILSFKIKKEDGSANDIVLGFDTPEDYLDETYLAKYPFFWRCCRPVWKPY